MDQKEMYVGEEESNYHERIEWKVFHMDNDVNLVRTGKHFHAKIGGKKKTQYKQKQP